MADELPLFPLNVVLFPGMALPLHIFEPRYREMIALCSDEQRPFGVLLIREGKEVGEPATPFDVGTTAEIVHLERLDDGRMNVITIGTRRFHLLRYSTEKKSYLVGDVELLEDPDPPDVARALGKEVAGLAQRYVTIIQTATARDLVPLDIPDSPLGTSFVVASALRVENAQRQELLEITAVVDRLSKEKEILASEIARVEALLRERNAGAFGPFSRN